jgi:hypothetical protein
MSSTTQQLHWSAQLPPSQSIPQTTPVQSPVRLIATQAAPLVQEVDLSHSG